MLFDTEQWRRLVPQSPGWCCCRPENTWVHYATFHLPPEFNGYYGYNALQQIAYFSIVFVFGPTAILTGMAMSPAAVNRFHWYAKLFGGRQSARSIHFLTMLSFFAFIVVHVTLIVLTGFVRNMNHIVMGTDDLNHRGMILGFVGIGVVALSWVAAHYISWTYPRNLQHVQKFITYPLMLTTLNRLSPSEHYTEAGYLATLLAQWQNARTRRLKLAARNGFLDYKLKIRAASWTTRSGFLSRTSSAYPKWRKSPCITASQGLDRHCQMGHFFP